MSARPTHTGGWVTARTFAEALGMDVRTIYRMRKDLPSVRARTAIRIPREFLDDILAAIARGGAVDLAEFAGHWKSKKAGTGLSAQAECLMPAHPLAGLAEAV